MKNKKGNRMFTATDLRNLQIIHRLLKDEGMTIQGVRKKMGIKWDEADKIYAINDSLQKIRNLLLDLRDNI
jgi:DNA-binding transcriptional MerR regulator